MKKKLLPSLVVLFFAILVGCESSLQQIPAFYFELPGILIKNDTTWSGNLTLKGQYYVLPGATLTIEAGTTVEWKYHNQNTADVGALIALPADRRNFDDGPRASGRIVANGTAENPIVFTSARDQKQPGDWGGIVLAGDAPTGVKGGNGKIEGLPQVIRYGGSNELDDSGSLKYIRIEYVGFSFIPQSEINGLSLYAVGSNTDIDHVQIYKSIDDSFEWFGGSVNAKYLVSMFAQDDSFDIDEGWIGNGQYWFALQQGTADSGIEADGVPGSSSTLAPKVYNATLIGPGNTQSGTNNHGMLFRKEFRGTFKNILISRFNGFNWLVADDTDLQYANDNLQFGDMLIYQNGGWANDSQTGDDGILYENIYTQVNPNFIDPQKPVYNFTPQVGVASNGSVTPSDSFFNPADYIGAFDPNASALWIYEGNWLRFTDD
ncbi:MAG: hypothetical protein U5J95_00265 [Balneolaceae bacterium]|nr:hypothetical protein [Balneolaceae bacterium]